MPARALPLTWAEAAPAAFPSARPGTPRVVARAALFLASDHGRFIAGTGRLVGGGSAHVQGGSDTLGHVRYEPRLYALNGGWQPEAPVAAGRQP